MQHFVDFINLLSGGLSLYKQCHVDNFCLMVDIRRATVALSGVFTEYMFTYNIHPSLNFTIETEVDGALPFLDMKVMRSNCKLSSTWYCKPTDTGLIMNFHALAPSKYKRSVVCGFVHRIFRACSSWMHFHTSLTRAKDILENNQYPASFYEPLISATIEKLVVVAEPNNPETDTDEDTSHKLFLQYRGKVTDDYIRALRHLKAPCAPVLTLRKLKTIMPSLKAVVDKAL